MRFEFATATRIVFGPGSVKQVGSLAKEFGRRALVITGRDTYRAKALLENLAANEVTSVTLSVGGEPTVANVEEGVREAKRLNCEVVISFGGGSALDAAKAIAAMAANPGEVLDYLEIIGQGRALTHPAVPFIAIPTTAGTGSEVTRNAVLASPAHRLKVSLRSPLMLPRIALIDPELTYELPPAITASTGMDALTQLVEPYVCARANPLTDAICLEGMGRAAKALPAAFKDGRNVQAREDMAVVSLFGGLALANAGLGAVHGFAGPIGGMFPAPHGAVCAALLPYVMAANLAALSKRQPYSEALERYRKVACLLTDDQNASPQDGVAWVRQLLALLSIPPLGTYGIRPEHTAELVGKAAHASSMKANPIALTREELSAILQQAI